MRIVSLLIVILIAAASPARAAGDESRRYANCLAETRKAPEAAYERAQAWQFEGGGDPARHCAAVALIGLDRPAEAARRLERLAKRAAPEDPRLGAAILAQAGQAWLLAEDLERAYAVQTTALDLDPVNVELLIDRSVTLAGAANHAEALADLDQAARLAPGRPEVLILRASALRLNGRAEDARAEVDKALLLAPENPEGLLERGILRHLTGDAPGARDDWLKALAADPEGPAADAARANLEALEVGAE